MSPKILAAHKFYICWTISSITISLLTILILTAGDIYSIQSTFLGYKTIKHDEKIVLFIAEKK